VRRTQRKGVGGSVVAGSGGSSGWSGSGGATVVPSSMGSGSAGPGVFPAMVQVAVVAGAAVADTGFGNGLGPGLLNSASGEPLSVITLRDGRNTRATRNPLPGQPVFLTPCYHGRPTD